MPVDNRPHNDSRAWTRDDATQWSVRERLAALAHFGSRVSSEELKRLSNGLPYGTDLVVDFSALAYRFGWVSPRANWNDWIQSHEAQELGMRPELTLELDIDGLVCLITTMVRRERFFENSLPSAVYAFATHITLRAQQLLAQCAEGADFSVTLFADVSRG